MDDSSRRLDAANSWRISEVRSAVEFFQAIPRMVPEATHMLLEGSPALDLLALLHPHIEQKEYAAPVGTVWSWPRRNQRLTLRASATLFARLSEAAAHHAEPEICSHLHFYRDDEALVHWFDAFDDPILVSKAIPRERVVLFCTQVHGVLSETAA